MSHFSVAVIMDGKKSLEEILAPYEEQTTNKKYLKFNDVEDEYRQTYENEGEETVRMSADGSLKSVYDEEFMVEITKEEFETLREKGGVRLTTRWNNGDNVCYRYDYGDNEVITVPYTEMYATFEEYMKKEHEYDKRDKKTNRYGYWFNPNAKWDWWQVGGRWQGLLKSKTGKIGEKSLVYPREVKEGCYDIARIGDIDFTPDEEEKQRATRFWEVVVEGQSLREGEAKDDFASFWKKEYYLDQYGTKEQYARECSEMSTFAVVTPDGKWHEKGEMGWFGCSSETGEEAREWHNSWQDAFIKNEDPDNVLVIVDCHI